MPEFKLTAALLAVAATAPGSTANPALSAKTFVDRLYGVAGPDVPDDQTYTPDLARLIDRASALSERTQDPDLVGNALCDCQNLDELHARSTVVSATADAATVRVVLTGGVDGPKRFVLKLVHGARGWRVADSISAPGGSYAGYLRRSLAGR